MLPTGEDQDRLAQWQARVAAIYGDAFVAKLVERCRKSESAPVGKLIGELLRDAAANYLAQTADFDTPQTLDSRQRKIAEIRKLAGKLESRINSLNKLDDELFWRPQRNGNFEILAVAQPNPTTLAPPELLLEKLSALIDPNRLSEQAPIDMPEPIRRPFGHVIRRIPTGDGEVIDWLQEPQIMEALTILQNLAMHADAAILRTKGKGGAPRRLALGNWVANMESLWTAHLGRRFTYSAKDGGSLAFHFCREAMEPLDSTVKAAALRTAVRSAVTLTRKAERDRAGSSSRKNPPS